MSDIVERLRGTTEEMANFASVEFELWNRHSNAALEAAAEITALRERVEKLEAALRPFAEEAARYEPPEGDDEQLLWGEFKLTIGSLRRARAAFEGK